MGAPDQAKERVMREFPHVCRFDPQATLDGQPAQARMEWVLSNNPACKDKPDAAIKKILTEFPWHDDLYCDGIRAAERAHWLVSNNGTNLEAAERKLWKKIPWCSLHELSDIWGCSHFCQTRSESGSILQAFTRLARVLDLAHSGRH